MEIIRTVSQMQAAAEKMRKRGRKIALVPTMGFLHKGHLSLMRRALGLADTLVVSLFVNPVQFGPNEDLDQYPRDFEQDVVLARQTGVNILFAPEKDSLYPDGFDTYVVQEKLPVHLCGLCRPEHFRGVLTIVAKLFNIVKPHVAVFGEKDFQQLAVIRRMVADLNFDIDIVGHAIVREDDGLAMSSRNANLDGDGRKSARVLSGSLRSAAKMVADGEARAGTVIKKATVMILAESGTKIDYVNICAPDTLDDLDVIDRPALMAVAVKIGGVRLIDNIMLEPGQKNV
ncbi:MAG: pantoate--beta-alanine ligase [Deltaproteobacteria bacterium]|nr:pantoate--beta-alanine ligase [Deltaproteobacteria bacterium]